MIYTIKAYDKSSVLNVVDYYGVGGSNFFHRVIFLTVFVYGGRNLTVKKISKSIVKINLKYYFQEK